MKAKIENGTLMLEAESIEDAEKGDDWMTKFNSGQICYVNFNIKDEYMSAYVLRQPIN